MERVVRHRHDGAGRQRVGLVRGGGRGVGVCFVRGDAWEASDGAVGDAEGWRGGLALVGKLLIRFGLGGRRTETREKKEENKRERERLTFMNASREIRQRF